MSLASPLTDSCTWLPVTVTHPLFPVTPLFPAFRGSQWSVFQTALGEPESKHVICSQTQISVGMYSGLTAPAFVYPLSPQSRAFSESLSLAPGSETHPNHWGSRRPLTDMYDGTGKPEWTFWPAQSFVIVVSNSVSYLGLPNMLLQNLVTWENSNYSFIIFVDSSGQEFWKGSVRGSYAVVVVACSQAAAIWRCTWTCKVVHSQGLTSRCSLRTWVPPQGPLRAAWWSWSAVWWLAFTRSPGH